MAVVALALPQVVLAPGLVLVTLGLALVLVQELGLEPVVAPALAPELVVVAVELGQVLVPVVGPCREVRKW